ncbi:MAG: hypothetical protein WB764_07830, partial [Xanthobacteraceae bacterium]
AAAGAAGPASAAPGAAATQGAAAAAIVGTAPPQGATTPAPSGPSAAPPFTSPSGPTNLHPGPPPAKSSVIPPPLPTAFIRGATSDFERTLVPSLGRKIEGALCLSPDPGAVIFGNLTRQAIQMFRTTTTGKNIGIPNLDSQGLTNTEGTVLLTTLDCNKRCYANAYEYFEYGPKAGMDPDLNVPAGERDKKLTNLIKLLAWAATDQTATQTIHDFCDAATRNLITRALAARGVSSGTSLSADVISRLQTAKFHEEHPASPPLATPKQ